jgi:hypothetical protein
MSKEVAKMWFSFRQGLYGKMNDDASLNTHKSLFLRTVRKVQYISTTKNPFPVEFSFRSEEIERFFDGCSKRNISLWFLCNTNGLEDL